MSKTLAENFGRPRDDLRQLRAPDVLQVDPTRAPGADRSARTGSWVNALGSRLAVRLLGVRGRGA